MMQGMGQSLRQRPEQRMSQNQIQSLDILALPAIELRERIIEELTENPALEIRSETPVPLPLSNISATHETNDYSVPHKTDMVSADSVTASDAFQRFLENIPDPQQQSLQEHLREQLFGRKLDPLTASFAERIIENLTDDGFHVVPLSVLFKNELSQKDAKKQQRIRGKICRALSLVRRLDPIGCATRDFKQALKVQARLLFRGKNTIDPVYGYALDMITHHFSYLEKARPYSLMRAVNENTAIPYKLTQENAEDILSLIASLSPFPGRKLSRGQPASEYIIPSAYIEWNNQQFVIKINTLEIPILTISPEFQDLIHHTEDTAAQSYIKEQVQQAKVFVGSLSQREKTIIAVLRAIVSAQKAFFLTGDARQLHPLTQQHIAAKLGIHVSTVSRAVTGKYVQCRWGTFEIQYFFTGARAVQSASRNAEHSSMPATREGIKACIQELIARQAEKLSDQKIADLLKKNYSISVARRTVAKYRKELAIDSSYDRML